MKTKTAPVPKDDLRKHDEEEKAVSGSGEGDGEGGLASEAAEISQQAKNSRVPKKGTLYWNAKEPSFTPQTKTTTAQVARCHNKSGTAQAVRYFNKESRLRASLYPASHL